MGCAIRTSAFCPASFLFPSICGHKPCVPNMSKGALVHSGAEFSGIQRSWVAVKPGRESLVVWTGWKSVSGAVSQQPHLFLHRNQKVSCTAERWAPGCGMHGGRKEC